MLEEIFANKLETPNKLLKTKKRIDKKILKSSRQSIYVGMEKILF